MSGFLKLSRRITDHWLWTDKPFSKGQAWIDLLLLANYEDGKKITDGKVIDCKRGDVNVSISYLASRWGWDRKKVRRFLCVLEDEKMASTNGTTHGTTITIENYTLYNDKRASNEPTNDPTDGQPMDNRSPHTRKERKEINNNNIYICVPEELKPAFMEFAKMRNKIKKPLTSEDSVKRQLSKLYKLGKTTEEQIAILHQSVDNCWQGLFPVKSEPEKKSYKTDEDYDY